MQKAGLSRRVLIYIHFRDVSDLAWTYSWTRKLSTIPEWHPVDHNGLYLRRQCLTIRSWRSK